MTAKMTREVRAGDIITGTYKSRGGATYERRGMVVQVERGTPEKELAGNIIRWEVGPSGAPTTEVTESLPSSPTSSPVTKHRRSRKQDKEPTVVGDDMLIRVLKWQNVNHGTSFEATKVAGQGKKLLQISMVEDGEKETVVEETKESAAAAFVKKKMKSMTDITVAIVLDRMLVPGVKVELTTGCGKQAISTCTFLKKVSFARDDDDEDVEMAEREQSVVDNSSGRKLFGLFYCFEDSERRQWLVSPEDLKSTVVEFQQVARPQYHKKGTTPTRGKPLERFLEHERTTPSSAVDPCALQKSHTQGHMNPSYMKNLEKLVRDGLMDEAFTVPLSASQLAAGHPSGLLRHVKILNDDVNKKLPRHLERLKYSSLNKMKRELKIEKKKFSKFFNKHWQKLDDAIHGLTETELQQWREEGTAFVKEECPIGQMFVETMCTTRQDGERNTKRSRADKLHAGCVHLCEMIRVSSEKQLTYFALVSSYAYMATGMLKSHVSRLAQSGGSVGLSLIRETSILQEKKMKVTRQNNGSMLHDNINKYAKVKAYSSPDGKVSKVVNTTGYAGWPFQFNYDEYDSTQKVRNYVSLNKYATSNPTDPAANDGVGTAPVDDAYHLLKPESDRSTSALEPQKKSVRVNEVAVLQEVVDILLELVNLVRDADVKPALFEALEANATVQARLIKLAGMKIYKPQSCRDGSVSNVPASSFKRRITNIGVIDANEMSHAGILKFLLEIGSTIVGTPEDFNVLSEEFLASGCSDSKIPQKFWWNQDLGSFEKSFGALRLMYEEYLVSEDRAHQEVALRAILTIERTLPIVDCLHRDQINGSEGIFKLLMTTVLLPLLQNEKSPLTTENVTANSEAALDWLKQMSRAIGFLVWKMILSSVDPATLVSKVSGSTDNEMYLSPEKLMVELRRVQRCVLPSFGRYFYLFSLTFCPLLSFRISFTFRSFRKVTVHLSSNTFLVMYLICCFQSFKQRKQVFTTVMHRSSGTLFHT